MHTPSTILNCYDLSHYCNNPSQPSQEGQRTNDQLAKVRIAYARSDIRILILIQIVMLRRATLWLPKQLGFTRISFPFTRDKKPQNSPKPAQKPNISEGLEKSLIQYIRILMKEAKTVRENRSFFKGSPYLRFFTSKGISGKDDNLFSSEKQAKMQGNMVFFTIMLFAALIFLGDGSQGESSVTSRSSKIVNETQMINLLAGGNFNLDLFIVREAVSAGNNPIYQTVCMAKQANKIEAPVSCVINNLPVFLSNLEKLNYPYRVAFNYSAEIVPERKRPVGISDLIFIGIAVYLFYKYKTGGFNFGNSGMSDIMNTKKFQPIKPENIKTHFKDVAGMHQAKQEITEFVDFLKNPDRYIQMGAKIPKGALLTGPPGTGKTLLARACAGQAGVPFFYVSGSEFVEKYVGMGANRVRSLFDAAAKSAPSIIFIDQIDAIGKKRDSGPFANEEKENTLNQLLVNMDGFDSRHKIIVMAATNVKDSLDPALLRPGRFDRAVQIGLPSFEERVEILKVHLLKVKFSSKHTIDEFARKISVLTPGFSGAELANICNEAAILAARGDKTEIELPEFQKATERVMAGLEKRNLFSQQERECLAAYECGKAVAAWFTEGADPVIKISITPYSKSSKGYSHEIKDEIPLKTETELLNKAACCLAGRSAEKLLKGYVTSNGDEDLRRAKKIISFLVMKFGMSKLGKVGFPDIDYVRKPYSEHTERKIDAEIDRIYKQCQLKAEALIIQRREYVEKLKALVLEKETLTHHALKEVLGERPFANHQNYEKFLSGGKAPEEPVLTAPDSVQPQ